MKRSIIAALPLLAMAGCSVGPDYEPQDPASLVPDAWLETGAVATDVDLATWWSQLGDDELSSLIERAFETNLSLAEARERIVAARARRGIQNADRLPTLSAEALYSRAETGDEGLNFAGPPPGTAADVFSLGAVAGWELDLWGRVGRLVEAADADIEFAVEDLRASRVTLASEIAREIVLIRAIDRDVELIEATVQTSRDAADIARSRSAAGFGSDLDVARAERDLETNNALLPSLDADRREAEIRLAVLLGEAPGAVKVSQQMMPKRDVVPSRGVPADLLMRRPDLRQAERAVAAATARIGAAKAERYPRVSLSGSIALTGPDVSDMVTPEAFALQAGPSITLPIFEGGRIRSRVQQAESEERQALLALQLSVLRALAEVETASMRRERAEERVTRLGSAETAALDAEELALDRYTAGQVDFLDVTVARQSRLAIERSRVAAERDALLRLVELYAALGGGWEEPGSDLADAD